MQMAGKGDTARTEKYSKNKMTSVFKLHQFTWKNP